MKGVASSVLVFALIVSIGGLALMMEDPDQSSAETPFGLSSTKISLGVGETSDLPVWALPSGRTYADIGWSSDDESVATVSYGTVTAVSAGTAMITAKVYKDGVAYTDTCKVTVTASPVDSGLTVYNPYSKNYDSAVLSGEAFVGDGSLNGVLSLSFNQGGYVIVSVAGSTYSWGASLNSMGYKVCNYSSVQIKIKVGDVNYTSTYDPTASVSQSTFVTSGGITYNQTAQSPSLYVRGLGYGTYDVTVTVYKDGLLSPTEIVSKTGSFTYSEGDGRYDTTAQFTRNYVWNSIIDGSTKLCSVKLTYDYAEYWKAVMKSYDGLIYYTNGIASARYESECVNFTSTGKSVTDLQAALRTEFESKYPSYVSDSVKYAQFIFSFLQIRFFYESDYTQYYDCNSSHSSGTDVWAYPEMTIYSGIGDCEDTASLLSSLFKAAGYDSALIVLPNHMMGALVLEDYSYEASFEYGGKKYYFCESTADTGVRIGYCSDDYEYKEFSYYFI